MKNLLKRTFCLFSSVLLLAGCDVPAFIAESFAEADNSAFSTSLNDYSVSTDPGLAAENYYNYVNQNWIDSTKNPEATPSISAFSETTSDNLLAVYQTLENNLANNVHTENTNIGKLTKFYASALDVNGQKKTGMAPIKPYLNEVMSASDLLSLQDAAAKLDVTRLGNFVSFGILPDAKDSTMNRLYLDGPVLGLSNKNYYDTSDKALDAAGNQKIIDAYKECLTNLFISCGTDAATAKEMVEAGYSIEEQLAASTLSSEDSKNSEIIYNKYSLSKYSSKIPNFDLTRFLTQVGIENPEFIIVRQPEYFKTLNALFVEGNLEALKAYVSMTALFQAAPYLTQESAFEQENFTNVLYGTSGHSDSSSQALYLCRLYMSEQLGELYVNHYFSEETKTSVEGMVSSILDVYKTRIEQLDWMNKNTKANAIKKLDNIAVKVGYPEQWSDLSNLTISSVEEGGSLFQNVANLYQYSYNDLLSSLDQPVDRSDWEISAFETNAYYKNSSNEIVIPAGILKEPFFSPTYTTSQNYGAIGSIIAHEISHAFDSDGRKYDQNGSLKDWWTAQDLKNYTARTEALVERYDNYELFPGYTVNGTLTLNENIADLGGLSCITELVSSLPPEHQNLQEMFQAYATIYREKATEPYLKHLLLEDPHSPSIFRVNGVLSNIDAYYEVYGVTEGNTMYIAPENRIQIW